MSLLVGGLLGACAGFFGRWVDETVMRIADLGFAFPAVILAIVVAIVLGAGLRNAVPAVLVVAWPLYARVTRSRAAVTTAPATTRSAPRWKEPSPSPAPASPGVLPAGSHTLKIVTTTPRGSPSTASRSHRIHRSDAALADRQPGVGAAL
ncbi:ABC transporter permease subunit [Streptomyces sp. NPDC050287]|uniref:ABC transporter permease subunit n=1 Tax=Streptomyces sp. NPDC050287 TaxID=3365608 RepID=UPI0037A4A575